jgi:hypothetical protein
MKYRWLRHSPFGVGFLLHNVGHLEGILSSAMVNKHLAFEVGLEYISLLKEIWYIIDFRSFTNRNGYKRCQGSVIFAVKVLKQVTE